MERYEKYKDSGVEWIGEIPEGWGIKKIKHRCYVKGRVGWKGLKSSEFLLDGFSYLVTGTDFKDGKVDWEGCYHIDKERYEEDPFIQLQNNDLLITKDGTIGKLAIVDNLDKPACLNSGIFVVRSINEDFTTRYLYWMLTSDIFTKFNEYTSYGSTIQHLYQNVFVEFAFSFPSRPDQIAIANYLDRKTAEIDELIAQKERLLELYEEEKTAIINQAVTKGIDPDVKLKDSGIDWLGEIPEGGRTVPLTKYLENIVDYRGRTPKKMASGMLLVTARNIKNGQINYSLSEEFVDPDDAKKLLERGYPKIGDVLFTTEAPLGEVANIDREDIALAQRVIKFRGKKGILDNYFLKYFLSSDSFLQKLYTYATGSTALGIKASKLSKLQVLLLPIDDQLAIVHHIETETARINAKIAKTKRIIGLQKEYRTALISEVVTGKIKVTQEAAS